MLAATIIHPWNVDLVTEDGVIGAPDWDALRERARPGARADRADAVPLPDGMRNRAPERLRRNKTLRQLALRTGLVAPAGARTRAAETELLQRLAAGRRRGVLIGVHEGSCALEARGRRCRRAPTCTWWRSSGRRPAWREHWDEHAVKALVGRGRPSAAAARACTWHVAARSEEAARGWPAPRGPRGDRRRPLARRVPARLGPLEPARARRRRRVRSTARAAAIPGRRPWSPSCSGRATRPAGGCWPSARRSWPPSTWP